MKTICDFDKYSMRTKINAKIKPDNNDGYLNCRFYCNASLTQEYMHVVLVVSSSGATKSFLDLSNVPQVSSKNFRLKPHNYF